MRIQIYVKILIANSGNTLATAAPLSLTATTQSVSDALSSTNSLDYYHFTLSNRSSFSLTLKGLTADANVSLIQDANRNGSMDAGETLASSTNAGALAEALTLTALEAGTYYVQVSLATGATATNYTLGLLAQAGNVVFSDYRQQDGISWGWNYTVTANVVTAPQTLPPDAPIALQPPIPPSGGGCNVGCCSCGSNALISTNALVAESSISFDEVVPATAPTSVPESTTALGLAVVGIWSGTSWHKRKNNETPN